ncbi:MAG: serine protease AprX, partial [Limisphaerales bacterium]
MNRLTHILLSNTLFRIIPVFLLLLLGQNALLAQQALEARTWVFFTDKGEAASARLQNPSMFMSDAALARREKANIDITYSDLPVATTYIEALKKIEGLKIVLSSRWMNGLSVEATDDAILAISELEFIKHIQPVTRYKTLEIEEQESPDIEQTAWPSNLKTTDFDPGDSYGVSKAQLQLTATEYLHKLGFRGQDMLIAIFDAGWIGVDELQAFSEMHLKNRIVDTWNFKDANDSVYQFSSHGTSVLSITGSNLPGTYIGAAPEAKFCLYRTEITEFERIIEEDYWLAAAERADQMGVQVINTSLGYTTFDSIDAGMNHTYEDMDGNTTIISRAADMAAAKGMLIVVSAGNQGDNPWFYISAPADGDSVLAIGATDVDGLIASFSGHGPSSDGDVKPNVSTVGRDTWRIGSGGIPSTGNGTSFSAPLITGAAACLWQGRPEWSNMDVFNAIQESSSQFQNPDTELGYGIPDFAAAYYRNVIADNANLEDISALKFVPNPADDLGGLFISGLTQSEAILSVFDASGKEIWQLNYSADGASSNFVSIDGIEAW